MAVVILRTLVLFLIVSIAAVLPSQPSVVPRPPAEEEDSYRNQAFGFAEKDPEEKETSFAAKAADESERPDRATGRPESDSVAEKTAGKDHVEESGKRSFGILEEHADDEENGVQDLDFAVKPATWSEPSHVFENEVFNLEAKPAARTIERSDDENCLQATVSKQAETILQLEAQVQALSCRVDQLDSPVVASARFSELHVTHLGQGQPLVFDVVIYNAGGGYDSNTGVFTAPRPGSYVVSVNLQRHGSDETTIMLAIQKGSEQLAVAEAGYSPYEHGSMLVTTRLEQGDTIFVRTIRGTTVFGGHATVFSVFRVAP